MVALRIDVAVVAVAATIIVITSIGTNNGSSCVGLVCVTYAVAV